MRDVAKLNINQWDRADRPREKMMAHGAVTLSTAELLAILIGSGSPEESAVSLMQRMLGDNGNSLRKLAKRTMEELCQYKGMGPAKALTVLAACELGKRRECEIIEERPKMDNSKVIFRYFLPIMQDLPVEECWIMLLNQKLRLIKAERISRGGLSETSADVRCVLREALLSKAAAIVLCHNHPSGSVSPGQTDDHLTGQLQKASEMMNIRLLDHLVVADGGYYSYADEGRI